MHLYHHFYSHCIWLTYSSDCSRVSSHFRRRACACAHHQGLRRFSLALQVFSHVLSQLFSSILAGKSQSRGLFVVSFSRSPSFYLDLLKNKGTDDASSDKRIQILDCYSDPLGWKDQLAGSGNFTALSNEGHERFLVLKEASRLYAASWVRDIGPDLRPNDYKKDDGTEGKSNGDKSRSTETEPSTLEDIVFWVG